MRGTIQAIIVCLLAGAAALQASDNAVIIQGWTPTEAAGLDWAPEGLDTLDELWNDCFLDWSRFDRHFFRRPVAAFRTRPG